MKPALLILALLATATATATATPALVHEHTGSLDAVLAGAAYQRAGEVRAPQGRKVAAVEPAASYRNNEAAMHSAQCMTQAQCNKKKVHCFNKCTSTSTDFGKGHASTERCILKCSKCLPMC